MLKWVHHTPSLPKNHTTVITRDSLKSNEEEEEEEEEKIVNNVPQKIEYDNTDNEDECKDLEKDEHIMIDISLKRRLGGSDPRVATCRGKLQNRRSKLNQEINKELRLRAGAENLFKATTNRKLKETVALELSFVNSNLQLLKEQLAELNSSVELYQNVDGQEPVMPMIPLGLKETKDIDFQDPFKVRFTIY
ncbi:hypothetical protein KQX54_019553 [Cotesia glomerata]|uniref:REM-1 domain-containing protein n=1 Tax=Cotesia glomerata TaxID=32391 RepID=A0AAV7HXE9_COTGL|nr:hypothetical protein KQX54_019553 [Cotesia glomerata]